MTSNMNGIGGLVDRLMQEDLGKEDFLVSARSVGMNEDGDRIGFDGTYGSHHLDVRPYAHRQLASRCGIPWKYYDEMKDNPELCRLRAINVNTQLGLDDGRMFVRTIGADARAFLSDSFRPMDDMGMLKAISPSLMDPDLEVKGVTRSDTRMYINVLSKKFTGEVRVGDPVQFGLIFRNSEVGNGAWAIEEYLYRLICSNGAVGRNLLRKTHIGSKLTNEGSIVWNADTIEAEQKVIELTTRDVVHTFLNDRRGFEDRMVQLKVAADSPIEDIPKTVENVTKRFSLNRKDADGLINLMGKERDFTQYGLANAVTAKAQEKETEVQYEYEKIGHQILDMSGKEFLRLSA